MKKGIVFSLVAIAVLSFAACFASTKQIPIWVDNDSGITTYYNPSTQTTAWHTREGWIWHDPTPIVGHKTIKFGAVSNITNIQYVPPVTDAGFGSFYSGSGSLYQLHCVLTATASAGPFYIQLFDTASTSIPADAAVPINGSVSGGMVAIGNDISFSDEQVPRALHFTNGLEVALSTNADNFAPPAAGNLIHCDAKISPY